MSVTRYAKQTTGASAALYLQLRVWARVSLWACALTPVVLSSLPSYAQRSPREAEIEVSRKIREANSYFDELELEAMDEALEVILDIARRFGTPTPRMKQDVAQAYILKGVELHINEPNERGGARRFFMRALETDPNVTLDVRFRSPVLKEIFEEARSEVSPQRYGRGAGGYGSAQRGYPQGQGGYGAQPQGQGGYGAQPQGYNNGQGGAYPPPRGQGGYPPQGQGGYPPQGQGGGYPPQGQGGAYPPQGQGRGYPPQGQRGYGQGQGQSQGQGYPPQGQGGYGQGQQQGYGRGTPQRPQGYSNGTPELSHTPPRQINAGTPFSPRLRVSSFLRPQVAWVRLFYQTINTNGAQRIDMRPVSEVDFEGQVPGNFITGERIQYYMVVYNQADEPIASYKNHREPQAVKILAGRYGTLVGGGGLVGGSNPADDSFMTLGIMPGTGTGRITNRSRLQTQKDKAIQKEGFAFSPFHVNLEIDFSLGKTFEIGIFSRLQIIEPAALGGVQLHLNAVNTGEQKLALRAGAGYGKVRHLVALVIKDPQTMEQQNYLDTTLEDPVFYKAGLSYALRLSETWFFKSALDFTHLIALDACEPIDQAAPTSTITTNCDSPSIHFDLNIGVAAAF